MNPAFSVVFLTTLIGAGQGLFLALYISEVYAAVIQSPFINEPVLDDRFYALGSAISVVFLVAGLAASFFHLGHPERAWRSAAMWRTSWLSREVIVLPLTMAVIGLYGVFHYLEFGHTLVIGAAGVVATLTLFLCTGMIYSCIKFLQEWASPLTVVNYTLLGCSSGFVLATAFAAWVAPALTPWLGGYALVLTAIAFVTRVWSLIRNARLKPRSTLQSAIGVRHNQITQKSQGFMGGSFNTREFFHRASPALFRYIKWFFLVVCFPLTLLMVFAGLKSDSATILLLAFTVQFVGLIAERWFFFAQANHPQNLYYQSVA